MIKAPPHELYNPITKTTSIASSSIGKKDDSDKLRYDLLPPFAIEKVVKILTLGAEKYAPGNWKYVEHWKERYTAALMRHLEAYRKGESIDPESGESHLSHMLCCGIFLLEKELEESNNHEIN
jgi:hypothetical protein